MNLVFNELSIYPIVENSHVVEEHFKNLLATFKETKKVYGFTHIRFPKDHATLQITTTKTFYEWVHTLTNRNIKDLILDICKKPFTDELEDAELDAFFESNYTLIGDDVPIDIKPVGLPVSYIKTMPSISLNSHLFWRNRKITIRKSTENTTENTDIIAYNICFDKDIASQEIMEWADRSMPKLIDNEKTLCTYLGFTKYQPEFTDDFMKQFLHWKTENFEIFKYLLQLMKDVQIHPFTGGMGQTENLKGRGKEASKRITISDRLSYKVENNIVTFIACKGHYEFH